MIHQAIEKILKAYFVNIMGETAPISHSLSYLAKRTDIFEKFSEDQKAFTEKSTLF